MWECECGREPVDYRLIWLRFLRKAWILPIAVLAGMLLTGSAYYYSRTAARGGRTYLAESIFYIDYAEDSQGQQYDYYNYYTWGDMVHTDYFLDNVYERLNGEFSREELRSYISATVESDVRYLYVRYDTHSPELSTKLASIMEELVTDYAGMRKEITSIEVVKAGDEAEDSSGIRLPNACFLGACLGLGIAVFGILVVLITDTSVFLPSTVEKRYRVVCLGAPFLKEFAPNWQRYFGGASRIALIAADEDTPRETLEGLGEGGLPGEPSARAEKIFFRNPVEHPEELEKLRTCDRTAVCLRAGRKNHETMMRLLEQLARQEIPVTAAILVSADEKLISAYYRSKK